MATKAQRRILAAMLDGARLYKPDSLTSTYRLHRPGEHWFSGDVVRASTVRALREAGYISSQLELTITELPPLTKAPAKPKRPIRDLRKIPYDRILVNGTGQRFRLVDRTTSPGMALVWGLDSDGRFLWQGWHRPSDGLLYDTGETWVEPPPLEPPAPIDPLEAENGWLDRDGRLYPCHYAGHRELATRLCYHKGIRVEAPAPPSHHSDEEASLEREGWVKMSSYAPEHPWFLPERALTSAQIDVIRLYCTSRKVGLPYELEEDEGFSLL